MALPDRANEPTNRVPPAVVESVGGSSGSGQAVADGLQAMVNGGASVQNFLVRKTNTDYNNVSVWGSIDVDFDLAE